MCCVQLLCQRKNKQTQFWLPQPLEPACGFLWCKSVLQARGIDVLTDIKSDNVYVKQLQYFPDNIAAVNTALFTPADGIHLYLLILRVDTQHKCNVTPGRGWIGQNQWCQHISSPCLLQVELWNTWYLLSFYLLKGFFSSFSLLLLRVKGRGCHTLLKPYETNCGLWIWAIQIKFDWLIDMVEEYPTIEGWYFCSDSLHLYNCIYIVFLHSIIGDVKHKIHFILLLD